jgi:hypothetical protein
MNAGRGAGAAGRAGATMAAGRAPRTAKLVDARRAVVHRARHGLTAAVPAGSVN